MSVKKQAVKSVLWSAAERFSVQGVQFVVSILIARILIPADFGLIAMLGIFIAIAQTLVESGLGNALIQKKERSDVDYSTVFLFNMGLSIALYLLLFAGATSIASFYDEPRLTSIIRVVSLSLLINAFGLVQQVRLTVDLDFKRLAQASLTGVVISGITSIILAYIGWGVWALVVQTLLSNLIRVIIIWVQSPWMPKLHFSKDSFNTMFAFSSKLLLSTLMHTLYVNLYTLIIGKRFAAADLGFYNRASTLAQFPSTNLTSTIVRAIYPIQCRLQNDDAQLLPMFIRYLRLSCFIIFPIMIALCALAEPLVRILLTDKWLPAVPLLQILSIAYVWDPVMKINHNILNVKGRSDYFLKAEIWKKAAAFLILFGTLPFGIPTMCMGLILYSIADMCIIIFYSQKVTRITHLQQFKELLPILLLTTVCGSLIYLPVMLFSHPWVQLSVGAIVGTLSYIGIAIAARLPEIKTILSIIKTKKR